MNGRKERGSANLSNSSLTAWPYRGHSAPMSKRTAFKILLSQDERAVLEDKAAAANLPLGTWMRVTALQDTTISGKNALNLLKSLEVNYASPEEMKKRVEKSKARLARVMAPKTGK